MCSLEKRGNVWFLTLTGDNQHRLNPTLIQSILLTLSKLSSQSTPGSVLITTAHGKYFSTGFDLAWARGTASDSAAAVDRLHFMVDSLKPVAAALMSLPMPTIAAVNGHASAAGFLLAICHDYVLMRNDNAVLYMPEVHLALPLPEYFAVVMRSKIRSATALRDVLLSGAKVTAAEAVKMGIVDSAHDSAERTVDAAMRLGERLAERKWEGEVYAEIRKSLYPEACGVLGLAQKALASKI
ncbi:enoyl-CoA delta isomerase 2, peroxisomal-like [Abrus precatorius]|uniref:Delta(3)-Delta(2)-enoyl-CoA isomerase n=1 Tax=Abrus precatorius TaxID=3816 RepID=A0A8B8K5Q2_ABRPR|nr:enoyl-CoA delta isomerase 2, peroxisomal-like [Abrus precatorius]